MSAEPSLADIDATVRRMESRYEQAPLFAHYKRLCLRFDADLLDPRDRALARSAALMLIKFADENSKAD